MATEQLEIKVGADVSAAVKGIVALTSQVGKLQKTTKVSADGIVESFESMGKGAKAGLFSMVHSFKPASDAIRQFKDSLKDVPRPLNNFNNTAKGTTTTLTNFSRIVSDAPYGIIGIANNIDPLVASFQSLKRETGSTGGALKALAGSLAGGGGIALAISAATSLAVVFSDELKTLFITSNKTKEAIKGIFSEANENAGADITRLEVFKKKLNDVNLPAAERIKIAKEYNKVADETNKIDLKQINNLDLINQKIDAQNKLIQQRALSTAALNKLTAASNKYIDKQLELQAALQATGLTYQQVEKASQESLQKQIAGVLAVRKGLDGIKPIGPIVGDKSSTQVSGVSNALISLFNQVKSGRYEFDKLSESLQQFITIDGLTTKTGQEDPKVKKAKDLKDHLKEAQEYLRSITRAMQLDEDFGAVPQIKDISYYKEFIESGRQEIEQGLGAPLPVTPALDIIKFNVMQADVIQKYKDAFKFLPKNITLQSGITVPLNINSPEQLAKLQADVNAFKQNTERIIQDMALNITTALAEGIGNAIAGGDVKSIFKSLFTVIGTGLQELGKQLIVASGLLAAFKKAFAALGPAGMAIAGVGMVAVGSALKNAVNKIPGFAKGTRRAPKGFKLVGEDGPELIYDNGGYGILPNKQTMQVLDGFRNFALPKFDTQVLSIPNMVSMGAVNTGVFGNTVKTIDSGLPIINFSGDMSISGDQLLMLIRRTERRHKRNF